MTFTRASRADGAAGELAVVVQLRPGAEDHQDVGSNGYTIRFCADATGNPTPTSTTPIKTGPYEGLIALQTPYQLDVTARTTRRAAKSHLIRTMEAVAIPVFQFGMFSDVDLAFFAGPTSTSAAACTPTATCFCRKAPARR